MGAISLSAFVGYLFGCFQTSILVGKHFANIDIREHSSQNAGASNTTVVLGFRYGLLVAFFDILKAYLAVTLMMNLFPNNQFLPVLAGTAAVLGHVFPCFFGFRGGKGVASLLGILFALDPFLGLISLLISIMVAAVSNYLIVGSLTLYALFVVFTVYEGYSMGSIFLSVGLLLLAVVKHLSNIQRIRSGDELKFRAFFSKSK